MIQTKYAIINEIKYFPLVSKEIMTLFQKYGLGYISYYPISSNISLYYQESYNDKYYYFVFYDDFLNKQSEIFLNKLLMYMKQEYLKMNNEYIK